MSAFIIPYQSFLSNLSTVYQNTLPIVLKLVVPYHFASALVESRREQADIYDTTLHVVNQTVWGIGVGLFYPFMIPMLVYRSYNILRNQHRK